jgi:hypothetical protein
MAPLTGQRSRKVPNLALKPFIFYLDFPNLKKALFRCSFPESPSGFGKTPQDAIDIKEENSRKYSMDDEGVEF